MLKKFNALDEKPVVFLLLSCYAFELSVGFDHFFWLNGESLFEKRQIIKLNKF